MERKWKIYKVTNNINGKITSIKDNVITIKLDNYQYIDDGDIISISLTNNNTINNGTVNNIIYINKIGSENIYDLNP